MGKKKLEKYEVTFRSSDDFTWSYFFQAENFAHAEEQALDAEGSKYGQTIIRIEKDYE